MKTYSDIYLGARRRLRDAGIEAHELEARLIVAGAAGKTCEELLNSKMSCVYDDSIASSVDSMIGRRLEGEPAAYILGEWQFYGIPVIVSDAVLIPRVDTELLADVAIKLLKRRGAGTRVLDLCAGCGCIGLAVASNLPDCRVLLADISERALAICRENILKNQLACSVASIQADALHKPPALPDKFDIIVSNPPYIPTGDINNLDGSVRNYEPALALDGGADGLKFFRAIAGMWAVLLKQGGYLAFECGAGQAGALRDIMREGVFDEIETHIDTLGIERVLVGRKGH
ncbi:MAG: peptide chain release factor N(5)-glutamine methyltransferase [Oscillospiraceae bacterium]|jgi:release factor glutamine methyltransferase|nr:peptide chain release factor N(5)-glutamine methyltransferase [Oscillospiraceae bacterium]